MGRHENADADAEIDAESDGSNSDSEDQLIHLQAVISSDTHVGGGDELTPKAPDATPSPARPDALVQHGKVGDGHELE